MIGKRISDNFKIVMVRDPALLGWEGDDAAERHAKYSTSYDLKHIDSHVLSNCTVFECKPLLKKWEHLSESAGDLASAHVLFKHHVKTVTNFPEFRLDDEGRTVPESVIDMIPIDAIKEIAMVIVRKAGLDTTPFMPLPTLSGDRMRFRVLHAGDAKTESANESSSE